MNYLYWRSYEFLKCFSLCLTIIISVNFKGAGQVKNSNIADFESQTSFIFPEVSRNVGDTLSSTGMKQEPPRIINICAVAPDILSLEIDACRIIPCMQIPYQKDSGDVVTEQFFTELGEPRNVYVVRDSFPLGMLVGPDRKTLTLHERIVGKHLDTNMADLTTSYLISSPGDNNYIEELTPDNVFRKSKPTGWTDTSWLIDQSQKSTAKHYIYLKLPYALKIGHTYLVRMPDINLKKTAVYYVHDPAYVRSEAVHASQIGFRKDDPDKNAFLSLWMGNGGGYNYPGDIEFSLIDDQTNERVFKGTGVLHWEGDTPEGIGSKINHSGTDLIRLNFSSFNTPGRYRVCVEGIGCSYPFIIDDGTDSWENAFKISMKGVFNHRSGITLLPPFTDFVRPRCFHPDDGFKVYQSSCSLLNSGNGLDAMGTDKNNFANLVAGKTDKTVAEAWGGYMDAGDWDRRIYHLSTPRLFLELAELNPDYFKNLCLYIPESGNDIPDIVDEALFGLDIYRRMQTPEGGIRGGVESSEHPSEGGASWQEPLTILAYAPDHWSSYIYAGVAARAAFVLKMSGKDQVAGIWEDSAIKAMKWAEDEYGKWQSDPVYKEVRDHVKRIIPAERNLAAIELYRLTKNEYWHEIYLSTLQYSGTEADFIYARLENIVVDSAVQQNAVETLLADADNLVELSQNNAYGITTASPGRAIGSSNFTIPASPLLVRAHYLSGDMKYLKTMLRSALYSGGANPMNMCLTTGLGENSVKNPLHEDTKHTGQPPPIGITVFGPCEIPHSDARHGSVLETRLNVNCTPEVSNWPTAESFFDVFWFVPMNEYVIWSPMGQTSYIWGYLASR